MQDPQVQDGTQIPGYGTIRQPGKREGRSEPPRRPIFAWVVLRVIHAVGRLPLRWIQGLGGLFSRALLRLGGRDVRNTRRNIRLAFPDWAPDRQEAFARQSLLEDGRMIAEHAALWTWRRERVMDLIREVHGADALQDAMDEGKGVLLAALHLGSIEALCIYCSTHHQLRSQYREPRVRELDPFFRGARERFGARLLPTSQGSVRLLLRGLKDGELIGIPYDQDSGDGAGVFAPFFGHLANTSTLVTRLARKSGARVFLAYALRRPGGDGYSVHFEPAPDAFYTDDVAGSATALNAVAERAIRQQPEQWVWSYRRWRYQPDIEGLPKNEAQLIERMAEASRRPD